MKILVFSCVFSVKEVTAAVTVCRLRTASNCVRGVCFFFCCHRTLSSPVAYLRQFGSTRSVQFLVKQVKKRKTKFCFQIFPKFYDFL